MSIIFASCVCLASEDPDNIDSYRNQVLNYFDYVFTAVFSLELILKVGYAFLCCFLSFVYVLLMLFLHCIWALFTYFVALFELFSYLIQ